MVMFNFGKKKEKEVSAVPGTPTDQVMALKQQGIGNDQIIQEMERQGYNSSQIFDALNQVNISGGGVGPEQPPATGAPPTQNFTQEQPSPLPQQQFEQPPQQQDLINKEQIEGIAEAIIDEKWKEFEHDIKIIIEWKDKTEAKVTQIEQQVKDLTSNLSNMQKSLISKISQYDSNITDVGTEIKAMEKVFQKILPNLTENVNKLDRIAKGSRLNKN